MIRVAVARVALTSGLLVSLFLGACLEPVLLPVPDIAIEPESPAEVDDLELILEDLGDNPAGLSWSIAWSRDDEVQEVLAGATLVPAESTSIGEVWTATVALVLGDEAGPPAEADVTIGGGGDDDASDDDDATGPDDDDLTGPGVGNRLCAAAGTASNGIYTASGCTGPVETAPGVATNGTYTVRINRLAPSPE